MSLTLLVFDSTPDSPSVSSFSISSNFVARPEFYSVIIVSRALHVPVSKLGLAAAGSSSQNLPQLVVTSYGSSQNVIYPPSGYNHFSFFSDASLVTPRLLSRPSRPRLPFLNAARAPRPKTLPPPPPEESPSPITTRAAQSELVGAADVGKTIVERCPLVIFQLSCAYRQLGIRIATHSTPSNSQRNPFHIHSFAY